MSVSGDLGDRFERLLINATAFELPPFTEAALLDSLIATRPVGDQVFSEAFG